MEAYRPCGPSAVRPGSISACAWRTGTALGGAIPGGRCSSPGGSAGSSCSSRDACSPGRTRTGATNRGDPPVRRIMTSATGPASACCWWRLGGKSVRPGHRRTAPA